MDERDGRESEDSLHGYSYVEQGATLPVTVLDYQSNRDCLRFRA